MRFSPTIPATLLLALSAPALLAQTPAPVIDCGHPFGLYDKMELVYQLQNADGKAAGTLRNHVVSLGSEQNKKQTVTTTTVLLKSGTYDTKQKLLHLQDLTFRCRQDTSFTDGLSELNPESLRSFRDRRFVFEPVPLAWPNQPTVGSELPSGGVSVQVSSTAVDIAKVHAMVRKRRVTGTETITTPAGTFQCYKVEAERESSTAARADMVMRSVVKVVDYYSPAVGLVKTEIYDKKGKLAQVRLLTAINAAGAASPTMPTKEKSKKS
ncbi:MULTISPECIES: TapB family protein [Hymenobacter]